MGTGGPMRLPSGRSPSRIAPASSASDQSPMRPSGVMSGAQAVNAGVSFTRRPERAASATGPPGSMGVWQLPQRMMPSTR